MPGKPAKKPTKKQIGASVQRSLKKAGIQTGGQSRGRKEDPLSGSVTKGLRTYSIPKLTTAQEKKQQDFRAARNKKARKK